MLSDDVRSFLRQYSIRLDKELGQHFLIDESILETIVKTARIKPGDRIIEIGPGIGILTRELLRHGANVTAVELDERFLPLLREFACNNLTPITYHLTPLQGNALHTPLNPIAPYKVVANIPYAITSPLLRRLLLELPDRPTSLTLLIQREVAETICAPTTEGILNVLVRLCCIPKLIRNVPGDAFLPPPEVESAILHIECLEKPLADKETIQSILRLTKHAMSGRRKMLRNTVGSLPEGMDALSKAGIDPTRRPQTLTVEEWMRLEREIRSGMEQSEKSERNPKKPTQPRKPTN